MTVFLFGWLCLLGASYAVKKNAHLGVDALLNIFTCGSCANDFAVNQILYIGSKVIRLKRASSPRYCQGIPPRKPKALFSAMAATSAISMIRPLWVQ